MLQDKRKKQLDIAIWQFILGFGYIIGPIVMIAGIGTAAASGGYYSYATVSVIGVGFYIGIAILVICGIARFVLWIMGIINAVQINNITDDDVMLLIFSILTFWIGHLIVAAVTRKKVSTKRPAQSIVEEAPTHKNGSYETKLKESFMHGVITSAEYEKKLKAHQNKTKK